MGQAAKKLGLCECGCGQTTPISAYSCEPIGRVRGQHIRYVPGHQSRGAQNGNWKGGRKKNGTGYYYIWMPEHPHADPKGYVAEHILVIEAVLNEHLPREVVIHHVNGGKADNWPGNLVVCQNRSYHNLLHLRLRALKACGKPNYRLCRYCGKWDDPKNMYVPPSGNNQRHRECFNRYQRELRVRRNAARANAF